MKVTPSEKVSKSIMCIGMVLVEGKTNPRAYWEFEAEIWLFDDIKIAK